MSIIERRHGNKVYLYLQLTGRQFYLGTEDAIDRDKVVEILLYLGNRIEARRKRDSTYLERVGLMLADLLPPEEREQIDALLEEKREARRKR